MLQSVLLFAGMGLMMYFLMIRPQQQQRKKLQELLGTLRSGDRVVTSSGIIGQVITVREKTVTLRTADSKLEVLKSTIAEITEKSNAAADTAA